MNVFLIGPPRTGTTAAYEMLSHLLPGHEPVGKDDFRLMDDDQWVPAGRRSSALVIDRHMERLRRPEPWIVAGADYLIQHRARTAAATFGPTLIVQTVREPTARLRSVWSYYRFNKGLIPARYDLDEFLRQALGRELNTGYPVVDGCVADCDYQQRLAPWLRDVAGPGLVIAQIATEDLDQALPKLLADLGLTATGADPDGARSRPNRASGDQRSTDRGSADRRSTDQTVRRNATNVPRWAGVNRLARRAGQFVPQGWPLRRWLAAGAQRVLTTNAGPPGADVEPWMLDIVACHPNVEAGHQIWAQTRASGGFRMCTPP
jgi:hypothetical protein